MPARARQRPPALLATWPGPGSVQAATRHSGVLLVDSGQVQQFLVPFTRAADSGSTGESDSQSPTSQG